MTKIFKKIIASALVCAITLTSIELTSIKAYAEETVQSIKEDIKLKETDEEIDAYIDELVDEGHKWEENDKKATTNSITYQLVDGIEKTVFYSDDIRYKDDNGNLVDYDSTLRSVSDTISGGKSDLGGYVYESISGKSKNYFPENISIETPVLSEKDSYSAKITPIEANEESIQTENVVVDNNSVTEENATKKNKNNNKQEKVISKEEKKLAKKEQKRERKNLKILSKGEALQDEIRDIYDKKQTKKVGMKYKSKDNKFAYEYISSEQGVKENIILDEVPTSNVFSFSLELKGAIAKKDKSVEGISFYNEDEDIVGGIQIPFMNDATGKAYSEDITYTLTDLGEGKYTVDMTVSEEYLKDKHRAYPVTIDPTVTWTGTTYMYDTYVANNSYKNENFYSSSVTLLRAGMLPSGSATTRSLLHWPKIPSTVNDKYISSANLSLYETGTGSSGSTVRAYRVSKAWNKSTVTWADQPSIDSSCYTTFTTKGTAGSVNTASVKTFVQDIANESNTNYGLMLRNTSESSTSKYVGYYNSRYTANAAYKPKLQIVYADRPSRPSAVTTTKSYINKGDSLTVGWEGISSSSLSYVQYKISEYNPDTSTWGDVVIPYSSSTKIGTKASGSKTITAVNALPEGYYKIVVRGVDSNGIVGVGASKSFAIDSTNPVLSSASISPTGTSSTNYGVDAPTLKWSASDKYFYEMQVSVDGGAYNRISTSASGSAKLDNLITEPGKHVISLRARDKALNVSTAKTFTYYYDSTMPTIESGSIAYNKDTNKATVRLSNVSCGLIGFANEVKYAIIKLGDAEVTDVSSLNKTATITYTDKTGKFELSSDDMNLSDGIYNVYISISDNSGHSSDIYSLQLFKFDNASYDGEEVLSSEYDEDNNVVTLSWNEDSNIQSVDVYSRYGEEGKFALEQTVTGAYKLDIATSKIATQADYRLVVNYSSKQKLSSAITVVKSEEENEDGTTKISYDMDSIDTDEDGLIDIYEMWELGTDSNVVDTDGDGFNDGYEVMSLGTSPSKVTADEDYDGDGLKTSEEIEKGTNPYLKDSDFDGHNDGSDSNPIKTDVSNQNNATYTTDVHMGLYDRKVTETDEDGKKSSYVCNIYSGITSQSIDIFGNITSYYYDSNSNNTACIKYYGGQFIANIYTYDKLENMIYMARNDFGYAFNYDNIGNLISIKIADRVLVNNTYRKTNDLDEDNESVYVNSSITYGNGTKYEYVYDTNNENIVSIKINNVLSYEMIYDENGNMIEQKDHVNNINYTYEYDDEGNIIKFNSSDGFSINSSSEKAVSETDTVENGKIVYSQNEEKRESIYSLHTTDEEVSETSTLISGDKVNIKTNGSNKKEIYVTNDKEEDILSVVVNKNDDNTATISNNGVIKKYTYDKYNNISAISNNGELLTSYKYDNLEQLTRENDVTSGKTITYKYDKGGNIISKKIYDYSDSDITSEAVETIDYEYKDSTWKDMLTKYDNQEITYDEIGNPLKYRDDMNFTWENGRCLSTVTNNNTKIKYSYNKDGVRVSKNVDGIITKYYLKDYDIISEETNGNIIWYLYNSSGNLLGFENNGNAYYYEKNLQNDIIGILDNTGKNLVSYYYDALGNITKIDGDSKLAKINPFRYRGYYYDEETGLYYLNSRYYDSKTGRFINADDPNMAIISAITNNNGNLYSYCNNNPVKNMDTTGYWITVDSLILNSISAITNWLKLRNPIITGARLLRAVSNYMYNKKNGKKYINSGKKIYGQKSNKTIKKLKFGGAKFGDVGCELIAIYNALCLKKKKPDIAKIALEFEINGGQMGDGRLGTNPNYIGRYLLAHKIKYTKYTSLKKAEASRTKGSIYILAMWCYKKSNSISTYLSGVHTIAINCSKANSLKIYNMYDDCTDSLPASSFSNMFSRYNGKFICAYKLK